MAGWLQQSDIPHIAAIRHWFGAQFYRRELQDWSAIMEVFTRQGHSPPGTSFGFVGLAIIHVLWGRGFQEGRIGHMHG